MAPMTREELDELERSNDPEERRGERPMRHERRGYNADRHETKRRDRIEVREKRERERARRS